MIQTAILARPNFRQRARIAALLAASATLAILAVRANAAPETTVPETTVPETTVPETTVPEIATSANAVSANAMEQPSTSGESVVFAHRWQAAQQLPYSFLMKGVVSALATGSAPIPTGMPIDLDLNGEGKIIINTIAVASDGSATLQVKTPQFALKGNAWGMTGNLSVANDLAVFSLNGAKGKTFDARAFTNPLYGIVVSPQAQVMGVASLQTPAKNAARSATTSSTTSAANGDAMSSVQNLARLMPQLWPTRAVSVGELWTIENKIPLGKSADAKMLKVGTTTLKLMGEEQVGGRALQHVFLDGRVGISGANAQAINDANTNAENSRAMKLIRSDAKISGDIWFDLAAGQIARAAFKVATSNKVDITTPAKGQKLASNWQLTHGFIGNIEMNLQP